MMQLIARSDSANGCLQGVKQLGSCMGIMGMKELGMKDNVKISELSKKLDKQKRLDKKLRTIVASLKSNPCNLLSLQHMRPATF
jgi:hypothetical protein